MLPALPRVTGVRSPIPLLDAKDAKLRCNNLFSFNARQTLAVRLAASRRIGQDAPAETEIQLIVSVEGHAYMV